MMRDVVFRKERFGALIYKKTSGEIYEANQVGSKILEICRNGRLVAQIVSLLQKQFDVDPNELRRDVSSFIKISQQRGLLAPIGTEHQKDLSFRYCKSITDERVISSIGMKYSYLSAPLMLFFDITNKCNLNCVHCNVRSGKSLHNELSTEEILKVIDELAEMKVFLVVLSGGEPLLHPDFFEILKYVIAKQDIDVGFVSNGTLIDDSVASELQSLGVTYVQISLDGAKPETHDSFRGKAGAFGRTVNGIKSLVNAGIDVGISTAVSKINYDDIPEVLKLTISLGAVAFHAERVLPAGRAKDDINRLILSSEQYKELFLFLQKKQNELKNIINVVLGIGYDPTMLREMEEEKIIVGCPAGRSICGITSDGSVLPCSFLPPHIFRAGNIRNNAFKQIWDNSPILWTFRKALDLKGKCAACKYLYQCGGGCRAAAYGFFDDFLMHDPHCWV